MIEKICTKCKEKKEFFLFYKDKGTKSGYGSRCKKCVSICSKESQIKNKEDRKLYLKKYNLENKDRLYENKKIYKIFWNEKNKGYMNNYNIERRKIDPIYKMKHNLRNRTNLAFKANGWVKNGGTEKLLCGTFEEVKKYIENKFTDGMNWNNYGKWHIDHIKPLNMANDKAELIKLFDYKNLQPLWAIDNIKKGKKL